MVKSKGIGLTHKEFIKKHKSLSKQLKDFNNMYESAFDKQDTNSLIVLTVSIHKIKTEQEELEQALIQQILKRKCLTWTEQPPYTRWNMESNNLNLFKNKTIVSVTNEAVNVLVFTFTDGTSVEIETVRAFSGVYGFEITEGKND